jgi:predicted Zn-dependent protease
VHLGRWADGSAALRRLLSHPEATAQARAEAHSVLGELELAAGRFRRARRHFAAAIGLRPHAPAAYVRYAAAVEADPDADARKGCAALRRAIRIDPYEPAYFAALGRLVLRMGDDKRAYRAFRRAARLRPDSLPVLADVVDGFVLTGRDDEARRTILAARFRAPNDAAIIGLWNRFRFDCLRREQMQAGRGASLARQAILPFPEPTSAGVSDDASPGVIRADRRSRPTPHVLRLFGNPRQTR